MSKQLSVISDQWSVVCNVSAVSLFIPWCHSLLEVGGFAPSFRHVGKLPVTSASARVMWVFFQTAIELGLFLLSAMPGREPSLELKVVIIHYIHG